MARKGGGDTEIIREMNERFTRCESWEMTARMRFTDDVKFCEGDSDNMYQWPEDVRTRMTEAKRVMLTINQVRQFCLDILNEARQARVAIKIRPTGGGASFDSAQVYEGLIKHIEYISNAGSAYQHGLRFAVQGGIGYWRVVTDFANDDSFDQEIFIRRIRDPLMVYLDPDINEFDGSDARFGIVFSDMPRAEFDKLYPRLAGKGTTQLGPLSWVRDGAVRTAEYFRRVEHSERLIAYPSEEDPEEMTVVRESNIGAELADKLADIEGARVRRIKTHKVEWFKRIGDEIVDRRDWPGVYIPIVRCVGEETVIDSQLDRKGHVRAIKDSQRMFNYNAAGSIEFGALQSKTPYMSPADAIEGFEDYWNNANTENFGVLPYNHKDDEGGEIPAPQRQQPPTAAPVFIQGMRDSAEHMRMASGQYQEDLGKQSNATSGVAITARQRAGDTATYHYLDHQSVAIRFTGKILLDLIPKVYDTQRVFKVLGIDGVETEVQIDPNAKQALQKQQSERSKAMSIFNPSVGRYEVEADVGPAFQTQRQEAWNAYVQILSQNKELVGLIGDLAFKCADFPGADEIAERLRRMVPAQALSDGPPPDLVKANQQIEQLGGLVKDLAAKLADKMAAHENDQAKNALAAYDSITKRLAALKEALVTDPEGLVELVREVILEAEITATPALGPALRPTPVLTGDDVAAQVARTGVIGDQGFGGFQGGGGGEPLADPGGLPATGDMTAGPPAAPGGAPPAM